MAVSHRNVALMGLAAGGLIALVSYIVGNSGFAFGLLFSLPLALLNFKAIDKILQFAFGFSMPEIVKVVAFVLYHLRFAVLVIILFLVIPKTGFSFGIGTFFGFLIAKIALGGEIIRKKDDGSGLG